MAESDTTPASERIGSEVVSGALDVLSRLGYEISFNGYVLVRIAGSKAWVWEKQK